MSFHPTRRLLAHEGVAATVRTIPDTESEDEAVTAVLEPTDTDDRETRPRRGRRRGLIPLVLGVILVIGGLVIAGYGFFELVITDVLAERAQARLAEDLEARMADAAATTTGRDAFVADIASHADDPTISSGRFDNENDVPIMLVQGDPSGLDPLVPDDDLPWIYETAPDPGQAVGRISIPDLGVEWIVVEGVDQADLRMGPGHMSHTPLPGQMGNAVISGHRTTYGAPFGDLDQVGPGDEIVVETLIGDHTFEVIESRVVAPTDVWVTQQWEGSWLTLTTCHPRGSARQRLIVFASLVDGPNFESLEAQFDGEYVVPEPATR